MDMSGMHHCMREVGGRRSGFPGAPEGECEKDLFDLSNLILSRSEILRRGGSHACPELVLSPSTLRPGSGQASLRINSEGRSRRATGSRAWEPALLQNCDLPILNITNHLTSPSGARFLVSGGNGDPGGISLRPMHEVCRRVSLQCHAAGRECPVTGEYS